MVDTSVYGEIQASIRNAQKKVWHMGELIDHIEPGDLKEQLRSMCADTGNLLVEAQNRCELVM